MMEKLRSILPEKQKEEAFIYALTVNVLPRQGKKEFFSEALTLKSQRRRLKRFSRRYPGMNKKIISYLGFAKKAGKLLTGVNTCTFAISKGKVTLVILSEDISENSEKKIMKEIRKYKVQYVKYGNSEDLSRAVGSSGRNVFAVCDKGFAEVILNEIDRESE